MTARAALSPLLLQFLGTTGETTVTSSYHTQPDPDSRVFNRWFLPLQAAVERAIVRARHPTDNTVAAGYTVAVQQFPTLSYELDTATQVRPCCAGPHRLFTGRRAAYDAHCGVHTLASRALQCQLCVPVPPPCAGPWECPTHLHIADFLHHDPSVNRPHPRGKGKENQGGGCPVAMVDMVEMVKMVETMEVVEMVVR
jgi:hypothetical protein